MCNILGIVVKKDIIYIKQRRKKNHLALPAYLVYLKPTFYFLSFSYFSLVPDVFL